MNIYEKPTIKANNYNEIEFFLKKFEKEKINIFYSFKSILWQGPSLINKIEEKLKKKKVNFIAEVSTDISLALSLLNFKIKYLSVSNSLENEFLEKIKSIAEKNNSIILKTENFKNFLN